ncbi:pfkb family [Moniliophthora roreri MCA 2997]|uniref:Pfkb family n=1 Tax=Moniliophthora roreri (strain MCA 2997) TaxID=1381753 RepID=V2X675_MONRO|nr:pfkb family [Moniliophthora roreri MCA 2997]
MAKLRKESQDTQYFSPARPLHIVASGTLFLTHTLSVPCHPAPATVVRAHSVEKTRGGSASAILTLLAQFPCVEAALVASLGGNEDGRMLINDVEKEGVTTRFCKVWPNAGVPSAWVLHANDNDTRTVVNHNPLPDITHEEFVSLLGPILAPENYPTITPSTSPTVSTTPNSSLPSTPRPSMSAPPFTPGYHRHSPAPFDWLHFEGRSVKTTLSNITGLDGLARERKWRQHCVFSIDVGRKGRQGVEALIPHADVLFVNKYYAQANSPHYATTPRAFLLSLSSIAPPHALLVAHWGEEGAAALSLPTQEYFQSSGWVDEGRLAPQRQNKNKDNNNLNPDTSLTSEDIRSVRSGSDFWADGRSRTPSSSAFSARDALSPPSNESRARSRSRSPGPNSSRSRDSGATFEDDHDTDSQGTEVPDQDVDDGVVDEVGAQDAFVAGMIYALSRKIAPGPPYTPGGGSNDSLLDPNDRGRWRLDECLRFATELAGRKARRRQWDGLADEMTRAGWLQDS